jgi:hypothetical protein
VPRGFRAVASGFRMEKVRSVAMGRSVQKKSGGGGGGRRTFSILKPDATARNLTGAVNAVIEEAGLRIVAQRRHLTVLGDGVLALEHLDHDRARGHELDELAVERTPGTSPARSTP